MALTELTPEQIDTAVQKILDGAQSYQTPAGAVTRANLGTLLQLRRELRAEAPRRMVMPTVVVDGF